MRDSALVISLAYAALWAGFTLSHCRPDIFSGAEAILGCPRADVNHLVKAEFAAVD